MVRHGYGLMFKDYRVIHDFRNVPRPSAVSTTLPWNSQLNSDVVENLDGAREPDELSCQSANDEKLREIHAQNRC